MNKETFEDYNLTESDIDSINEKIDYLKTNLYNTDYVIDNLEDKCNHRVAYRLLDYDYFLKILYIIFFVLFLILCYKIKKTDNKLYIKIIKSILSFFFVLPIFIGYTLYKLTFPFYKTMIYNDDYTIDTKKNIEPKYLPLPNWYIIKNIINKEDKDNYLTITNYFEYLFKRKEFKIFNINNLNLHKIDNKINDEEIKTSLWYNKQLLKNSKRVDKDYGILNKLININHILKYYFINIFLYNWPLLFDNYKDDDDNYTHIHKKYYYILNKYYDK